MRISTQIKTRLNVYLKKNKIHRFHTHNIFISYIMCVGLVVGWWKSWCSVCVAERYNLLQSCWSSCTVRVIFHPSCLYTSQRVETWVPRCVFRHISFIRVSFSLYRRVTTRIYYRYVTWLSFFNYYEVTDICGIVFTTI